MTGSLWRRFLHGELYICRDLIVDRGLRQRFSSEEARRLPVARLRRLFFAHTQPECLEWLHSRIYPADTGIESSVMLELADKTFSTFEATMTLTWKHRKAFAHALEWMALAYGDCLQGLPFNALNFSLETNSIWAMVIWRFLWAEAMVRSKWAVEPVPSCLPSSEYKDIPYLCRLWQNSHHRLWTQCGSFNEWGDDFLLLTHALARSYPSSNAILCVEELPDLVPLLVHADFDVDNGWQKRKSRIDHLLTYLLFRNEINTICHIRYLPKGLVNEIKNAPDVFEPILRSIFRLALGGELPGSWYVLPLASRIRLDCVFFGPPETRLTRDELCAWFEKYKFSTLSLFREHFVTITEMHGLTDDEFCRRTPTIWPGYKRAVRASNALIRVAWHERFLSLFQSTGGNFYLPHAFELDGLFAGKEVLNMVRQAALNFTRKVKKGNAEEIIAKSMTAVELSVMLHHAQQWLLKWHPEWLREAQRVMQRERTLSDWLDCTPSLGASKRARLGQGLAATTGIAWRPGDEELVLLLQHIVLEDELLPLIVKEVQRVTPVMREWTAWLSRRRQLQWEETNEWENSTHILGLIEHLGLEQEEYTEVMRWIYYYNVFDLPDNGYKKLTEAFGKRSLTAFFKVLFYFELIKRELHAPRAPRFLLTSSDIAQREIMAMRAKLKICAHEASLPDQHLAYICGHCQKWASHIKPTPAWLTDYLLVRPEPLTPGVLRSTELVDPMPPGKSWHTIDFSNGQVYCHRAKPHKMRLAQQRVLFKFSEEMGLQPDEIEHEDQLDDDEEEEEEDDEEADIADLFSGLKIEEGKEDDLQMDADILNLFGNDSEEEEEDEEEELVDLMRDLHLSTESPAETKRLNRIRKKQERNRVDSLFKKLRFSVLFGEREGKSCLTHPLLGISLCGVRLRYDKLMLTRCTYCGDLTEWTNEKRTNYGISCMHHTHPGEFAVDHPHTRKVQPELTMPREKKQQQQILLTKCFYCSEHTAKDKIRFFDALNRVAEAYLCTRDLALLGLSGGSAGTNNTRLLRPLPYAAFLDVMNAGREKKKKEKKKQTGKKALPIPVDVRSSKDLAAAIQRHPRWDDWRKAHSQDQAVTNVILWQRFPAERSEERSRWTNLEAIWSKL